MRESLEQWQMFWMFPLIFAVVVTAMFVIGFRDEVAGAKHGLAAQLERTRLTTSYDD